MADGDFVEHQNMVNAIIKSLKILIENPDADVVFPEELSEAEGFEQIYTALFDIRKAFLAIGKGELDYPVKAKGYFPGAIKNLQASLLHLTWKTTAIASGDFTQRVDFLGAFSDAFNRMTSRLEATVKEIEIKEKESREAKEHFETIFNTGPDAILISRLADGCIVDINEGFIAMSGFTREEVIGKSTIEIDIWENPEERKKVVDAITEKNYCTNYEFIFRRKDGIKLSVIISSRKIVLQSVDHIISVIHNITERKQAEDALRVSEEKYRLLTEFSSDTIWVLNLTKKSFTYISPAVYELRGFTPEEAIEEGYEKSVTPESLALVNRVLIEQSEKFREAPDTPDCFITQIQQYHKNGDTIWVEVSTKFRYNTEGEIEVVGVSRNIEERKKAEKQILYLSYNDQLTGLYNRRYYEEELKRLDDGDVEPLALVMIDVNGLKLTNDAFGHKTGDLLLEKTANILKRECNDKVTAARIGGDEFVLLMPETGAKDVENLIWRINQAVGEEKMSNTILSLSIGYAVKQSKNEDMNEVFKKAEDEMYRHKLSESFSMRSKTIDLIMSTLFAKNNREMLHSKRVSRLCAEIAQRFSFDNDDINQIKIAGLMHDIGKIGIHEKILNKKGMLTEDEWKELERHPEIGYRILSSVNEFSEVAEYILQHHERWDGDGYPKGLKGEKISLQARIIAVADAYDAMTSDRTYRKKINQQEAIEELRSGAGIQFDPDVVTVFIRDVLKKQE